MELIDVTRGQFKKRKHGELLQTKILIERIGSATYQYGYDEKYGFGELLSDETSPNQQQLIKVVTDGVNGSGRPTQIRLELTGELARQWGWNSEEPHDCRITIDGISIYKNSGSVYVQSNKNWLGFFWDERTDNTKNLPEYIKESEGNWLELEIEFTRIDSES